MYVKYIYIYMVFCLICHWWWYLFSAFIYLKIFLFHIPIWGIFCWIRHIFSMLKLENCSLYMSFHCWLADMMSDEKLTDHLTVDPLWSRMLFLSLWHTVIFLWCFFNVILLVSVILGFLESFVPLLWCLYQFGKIFSQLFL